MQQLTIYEPLIWQRVIGAIITSITFGLFVVISGQVSMDHRDIYSIATALSVGIGIFSMTFNRIRFRNIIRIERAFALLALSVMWNSNDIILYFIADELIFSFYWMLMFQVSNTVMQILIDKYNKDVREISAFKSSTSTYGKILGLSILIFIPRNVENLTIAITILVIYFEICNEWFFRKYKDDILKMDKARC